LAVGLPDTYTPAADDDTGRCPADFSSDDLVAITRHMTIPIIAAMMIVATTAPMMMKRNIRSSDKPQNNQNFTFGATKD